MFFKNTIKIYLKNGKVLKAWKEGNFDKDERRFFKYIGFGKVISIIIDIDEVAAIQNNFKMDEKTFEW